MFKSYYLKLIRGDVKLRTKLEHTLISLRRSMIHLKSDMKFMVESFGNILSTQVMNMMNGVDNKIETMKQNIVRYFLMKSLLRLTSRLNDRTAYLLEDSVKDLGLMGIAILNGIVEIRANTYIYFFLNLGEYTLMIRGRSSRNFSFDGSVHVSEISHLVHTAMARGEEIKL